MKKELHITATLPEAIKSCKQHFSVLYPKKGKGSIELTPFGDYILNTDYNITEGAARRTVEYKSAYQKVTMDMVHAFDNETRAYTSLHRNMKTVTAMSEYQQELMSLAPQKYVRSTFILRKPTKDDIENDLRNEVASINFDKTNTSNHVEEREFIKTNLSSMIEIRQNAWQEAYNLFELIEDAKAEKANAQFFAEYKTLYDRKKEYIEGNESVVLQEIDTICQQMQVPYNLSLSYTYSKKNCLLNVDVLIDDGITIPTSKASVLSSGKISIKNKLVKEMITDKTNSATSLIYYLASYLYSASPNIQYLRMSLFDRNKQNPLLWVEFERDKFSKTKSRTVEVTSDILGYPNVLEFKNRGDALELCSISQQTFTQNVAIAIHQANEIHPKSQSAAYTDMGNGMISISFDDAQKLSSIPNISSDIRKAVSTAKDKGLSYVIIDKKYTKILSEFN